MQHLWMDEVHSARGPEQRHRDFTPRLDVVRASFSVKAQPGFRQLQVRRPPTNGCRWQAILGPTGCFGVCFAAGAAEGTALERRREVAEGAHRRAATKRARGKPARVLLLITTGISVSSRSRLMTIVF